MSFDEIFDLTAGVFLYFIKYDVYYQPHNGKARTVLCYDVKYDDVHTTMDNALHTFNGSSSHIARSSYKPTAGCVVTVRVSFGTKAPGFGEQSIAVTLEAGILTQAGFLLWERARSKLASANFLADCCMAVIISLPFA